MQNKNNHSICYAAAFTVICLILQSCYYQKPDITRPVVTCDTTNITYSRQVVNILQANCYSCHSAGFPSGGIALDSYAGVKMMVDFGLIPSVFFRTPPFRMPKNQDPLTNCEIAVIRTWIRNGAPNN